jgi:protein involved in temperature-dependent protein secretion
VIVTEAYAEAIFTEALQSEMVRALQCAIHRRPWDRTLRDDLLFQLDCLKGCIEKLHEAYVGSIDACGERLVGSDR